MGLKKLYQINSLGIKEVSFGDIRIERLEDRVVPKVPFPHKHDFFQLIIVTKGSGWHEIDFTKYKVSVGQFFFVKPAQVHNWSLSKSINGIVIEFSRESLGLSYSAQLDSMPDLLTLNKTEYTRIKFLAKMMLEEFKAMPPLYDIFVRNLLGSFLVLLNRKAQMPLLIVNTNKKNLVEEFRKLLEFNYRREHTVEFYAKSLKTNAKNLTMILSRAIELAPRTMIQERIILEAKRYLGYSKLSIAEIGYELGFDDSSYFSRFFKTNAGMTAAEFRKNFQK